jgi:hypothetical protein
LPRKAVDFYRALIKNGLPVDSTYDCNT